MKSRPILFSTPMVQAILEGRKTQTRRVIKEIRQSKYHENRFDFSFKKCAAVNIEKEDICSNELPLISLLDQCPYGQPGDVLWVRETWALLSDHPYPTQYLYAATDKKTPGSKWKPSIFMPREACRLFLKITNIRVERLQDISESDSSKEGIKMRVGGVTPYDSFYQIPNNPTQFQTAKQAFKSLWQSINGPESWDSNPFVWVIEFEKTEKP